MKLGQCTVKNFGSYKHLEFDYADPGLTLVHGKTGSGKSTLPDIACWALYGITARGGNVADICSWTSDGEPTYVGLDVETSAGVIQVVRQRGNAKQNDLYWLEVSDNHQLIRGKDINDTQKKLVARLGVDADSFITSAYLHEFSEAGNFFTLRAKDRRYLFERIANLDLPSRLAEASSAQRKEVKGQIATSQRELDKLEGKLNQLIATHEKHIKLEAEWADAKNHKLQELKDSIGRPPIKPNFSVDWSAVSHSIKNHMSSLRDEICSECGGPKAAKEFESLEQQFYEANSKASQQTQDRYAYERACKEYLDKQKKVKQLEKEENNPWAKSIEEGANEIEETDDLLSSMNLDLIKLQQQETSLDQLYDLSSTLRGELLRRTVKQIEHETNRYLETYFDAEIRVEFNIDSKKDDIEVGIKKSGYDAVYTQLSKGQRSLLRLCFSVSVMEQCANKTGIHQDCLFFDEFTDGLDEALKEKVFGLLSELETRHSTVMVIDHSTGFQNMFNKKLRVTMEGDTSYVQSEDSA